MAIKYFQNILLVILGMLVAGILIELGVRTFLPEPVLPRFVIDSGYGVRDNDRNVVTTHYYPNQYNVMVTTNSHGLRGNNEYTLEKQAGVYRIAMLGDSFLFGHGVNDEEVVSSILEGMLNTGARDQTFEVLNFGVSGFGPAQELVTYGSKASFYDPDLVIIFYFNNDIGNAVVSQLYARDGQGQLRRTGKEYLPGVRAREWMYSIAPLRWLFEHSQAWNVIRNRLSGIVHHDELRRKGLRSSSEEKPEAVRLTRALVMRFAKEIHENGSKAGLFVIPNKTLNSNFLFEDKELVDSYDFIINGSEFLTGGDYYERDGHWTAAGHRKAASAIKAMLNRLLVE